MAINLAEKYSTKVAERFSIGSRTDAHAGKDYEFAGVKTIKVYSVNTVPTSAYNRTGGAARFGELVDLDDTVQEMSLTQDRGFTFSIDAGNASEQFNIKHANACLKREIDEVVTPEVDKYRLAKWAAGAGLTTTAALSKDNIVEEIFTASAEMSDNKVPLANRTLFIRELEYVKFKLADIVVRTDSINADNIRNGYKGTIDGMAVVTVPSSIMPDGVNFIIKQKGATVDPMKLKNYRVHKNPMGVDGDVVEGRYIYDSFVLETKANGVFVHKSAQTQTN